MINEEHVDCDRLTDTGIGKRVDDIGAVDFVGQALAKLGQTARTVRIMDVG